MQDIFLSYSSKDRDRLAPLVHELEAEGGTVFWDHRSIKVAQDWHQVIGAAIQQCPCVIVAWSEASVLSHWVKEEALIGRDRGVLYPLKIDQVSLPFGFNLIQAADFTQWNGKADHPEFIELKEQLSLRLNLRRVMEPAAKPESVVIEASEPVVQTLLEQPVVDDRKSVLTRTDSRGLSLKLMGGMVALAVVVGGAYWYSQLPGKTAETVASEVAETIEQQPVAEAVKPAEAKKYKINVQVEPADATVTINGGSYRAGHEFVAGAYRVRASAEGYVSAEEAVEITDSALTVMLKLKRKRLPFEPEMVEIPGGTFTMGCLEERDVIEGMDKCPDNQKPAHEATVNDFLLAKTEVTVGQFRAFVEDVNYKTTAEAEGSCWSYNFEKSNWEKIKGNSWRKLGFEQEDDHPVACVSWEDAQAYVGWLRKKTGKPYRLPTEAEWEYAVRAGAKTAFSWGNKAGKNKANCRGSLCGDSFKFTAPVASFSVNSFGLNDMHGNVWEWIEDCYQGYEKAPRNGSAVKGCDAGASRVLRGGAWGDYPWFLRSATRNGNNPAFRIGNVGFRAARTN